MLAAAVAAHSPSPPTLISRQERRSAINSAGRDAVQTFGPAPNVAKTAALAQALTQSSGKPATLILPGGANFVVFGTVSNDIGRGGQACSIADDDTISVGTLDNSDPSNNAIGWGPNTGLVYGAGLTAARYVLAFNDPANSHNFSVAANSIDGSNNITPGTPLQVASQSCNTPLVSNFLRLTDTTFALGYTLQDNSAWVVLGSVDPGTLDITLGTPIQLDTAEYEASLNLAFVSAGKLLAAWSSSSGYNIAVITYSALTATLEAPFVGGPGSSYPWLVLLSATLFIIWNGASGDTYVGQVSGNAVSLDTSPAATSALPGQNAQAFGLSATQWAVSGLTFNGGDGSAPQIGMITEELTVTYSAQSVLPIPPYLNLGTPTDFVIMAAPVGGKVLFADQNFAIFAQDETGLVSPAIQHQYLSNYWVYGLSATKGLATLESGITGNSARVINMPSTVCSAGPIGLSPSAVTRGNPATISLSGSVAGFSGLTAGTQYYVNGDGTRVTANTGHPIGVALDATHMLAV